MKIFLYFTTFLYFASECGAIFGSGILDLNILKCMWKKRYACPHPDVRFILYTPKAKRGKTVDIRKPDSFVNAGYQPKHETVLIIHGFNGTQTSKHIMYLKDAYISREYNVIAVDWERLTNYPCYLTSLSNTKLVSQCTAQLYSYLTYIGTDIRLISCVGHSLGAHICGMMTNHLSSKQHKIIGLDPAKPIVEKHGSQAFRLTQDDATVVQIIHTNAGFLGQTQLTGSVDFCINGGRDQPFCSGHAISKNPGLDVFKSNKYVFSGRSRCSHFLSVCYLANAIYHNKMHLGHSCPRGCTMRNKLPFIMSDDNEVSAFHHKMKYFGLGQDTSESLRGTYCLRVEHAKHCPFS